MQALSSDERESGEGGQGVMRKWVGMRAKIAKIENIFHSSCIHLNTYTHKKNIQLSYLATLSELRLRRDGLPIILSVPITDTPNGVNEYTAVFDTICCCIHTPKTQVK